jgi:hypothetical protein
MQAAWFAQGFFSKLLRIEIFDKMHPVSLPFMLNQMLFLAIARFIAQKLPEAGVQ